jgi:hypothetical protein
VLKVFKVMLDLLVQLAQLGHRVFKAMLVHREIQVYKALQALLALLGLRD